MKSTKTWKMRLSLVRLSFGTPKRASLNVLRFSENSQQPSPQKGAQFGFDGTPQFGQSQILWLGTERWLDLPIKTFHLKTKTGPCNSNVKKKWNIHEEMPEHILTPGLVLWRIEIPDHYSGISTERFHFNRFPETLGSSPKMNLTWNWSFSSSPAVSGVGRWLQAD